MRSFSSVGGTVKGVSMKVEGGMMWHGIVMYHAIFWFRIAKLNSGGRENDCRVRKQSLTLTHFDDLSKLSYRR